MLLKHGDIVIGLANVTKKVDIYILVVNFIS